MAEILKSFGAGYNVASPMFPGRLRVTSKGRSLAVVKFQTDNKDTQIEFQFDESFPSRVPKAVVTSVALGSDQKDELCAELQRRGKSEEYTNTLMLPVLLERATQWLTENHGRKPTGKQIKNEIREETWQLGAQSVSELPPTRDASKHKEVKSNPVISNYSQNENVSIWVDDDVADLSADTQGDFLAPTDDWCAVEKKKKPKRYTLHVEEKKRNLFTLDTVPRIRVAPDSRRANFFVAIRCNSTEIGSNVESVVKKMLDVSPVYKPICYNRNEIHVTLTTVALHSEDEVNAAREALGDAASVIRDHKPASFFTVSGVDNFQEGKVVFGKVKVDDDVLLFRKVIRWAFQKAGIAPKDNYDYHPHMTIAKTNYPFTRKTGLSTIAPDVYEGVKSTFFGHQRVCAIHLCQMGFDRREDGFYVCPYQLDF